MTISDLAADAIAALTGTRWSIIDAPAHVPAKPGLYAIFGDERAHRELGLLEDAGARSAPDLPLYVGKAEASFVERDLKDHFAAVPGSTARTGGSTVRRSFAALLRGRLDLHGVPRNREIPGYFSMYSLAVDGDAQLTAWMHARPSLAVRTAPVQMTVKLVDVETQLIRHSTPVINIDRNPRKLSRLGVARKAMSAEAKAWRPAQAAREGGAWPMNGSRGDAARERLDAALLAEEVVLRVAEAKTILPSTKGLLAVTATRVIYTSKRRSWTADLRQVVTASLTREGSRGTIRITSASHVEVFSANGTRRVIW